VPHQTIEQLGEYFWGVRQWPVNENLLKLPNPLVNAAEGGIFNIKRTTSLSKLKSMNTAFSN
jgi:hypothetical protein